MRVEAQELPIKNKNNMIPVKLNQSSQIKSILSVCVFVYVLGCKELFWELSL